ncbi:hypothetical protein [Rhizosaccharibacter radicis]|uniref:Uncharacterized protein n=1 Tax=Rhizosaccharibacter radicis TaxID=2782605 RepID=A0ABT1VTW4_9PROT|nr:hypothetical protein [Acetobacteraceae bacterium KSS12]
MQEGIRAAARSVEPRNRPIAVRWLVLAAAGIAAPALTPAGCLAAHAAAPRLMPARSIAGFDAAAASARAVMGAPVAWPRKLPDDRPLFAYADDTGAGRRRASISLDRTANCHGAHYCSIGTISVSADPVETLTDRNGRIITRHLADGASFTPEHAMADNFPAELQWRRNGLTYTVSWSGLPPAKAAGVLAAVKRSAAGRAR